MLLQRVSKGSSREKIPKAPERNASTTVLRSEESSSMITRTWSWAARNLRVTMNPADGSLLRLELMMHTSGFLPVYAAKISAASTADATTESLWRGRSRAVAINSQLIAHDSATRSVIGDSFSRHVFIWVFF